MVSEASHFIYDLLRDEKYIGELLSLCWIIVYFVFLKHGGATVL